MSNNHIRLSVEDIKKALAREYSCNAYHVKLVVETAAGQKPELYALVPSYKAIEKKEPQPDSSNPPCVDCGGLTTRAGSCFLCSNCGATSGCS